MFDSILHFLEGLTNRTKELYTGSVVESNFQTLWHNYLDNNPPEVSEAHELKLCKDNSFAFDRVSDNQIDCLKKASTGFYYKISDMAAQNGFASPKPFDDFYMTKSIGYVVICFYVPRKYKKVFKIPIDQFIQIRDTWPKKSIRLDQLELQIKPIEL